MADAAQRRPVGREGRRQLCVYRAAPARAAQGDRTVTTDGLSGIQALERQHSGLPLAPGKVARREFEYLRHGTCPALLSRDVVTGQGIAPSLGPTRTAQDCLAHVQGVVASDEQARQWHVVVDKLNTHHSEAVVRWVAAESELDSAVGATGKSGSLHTQPSGAAFLGDPRHRIVLHYTPKPGSWLNPMELWLRILVRKLRTRGSFPSVAELQAKILAFIDYYNRTMAKPFKWTYQGKPLVA